MILIIGDCPPEPWKPTLECHAPGTPAERWFKKENATSTDRTRSTKTPNKKSTKYWESSRGNTWDDQNSDMCWLKWTHGHYQVLVRLFTSVLKSRIVCVPLLTWWDFSSEHPGGPAASSSLRIDDSCSRARLEQYEQLGCPENNCPTTHAFNNN